MKTLSGTEEFIVRCRVRVVVYSMIFAVALGINPASAFATTTTVQDRTPYLTEFAVQTDTVIASCAANNCKASAEILNSAFALEWVVCNQPTCTLYAHVESDAQVSAGDTGRFTFVVTDLSTLATLPITPGPTNPDGSIAFLAQEADRTTHYGTSASVLTTVPQGSYGVSVEIGCLDAGGGGCSALSFHSTLSVDVYSN